MDEFINAHCHLLNFKFVPDEFFKTRTPVKEWLLRRKLTAWIAHVITFFLPGRMYDRINELLEILDKDIEGVTEQLLKEMKESGIATAIPLMMDLESACSNFEAEVPYRHQIHYFSEIAGKYPGVLMPFVMLDPQRQGSADLVFKALEELGFLGVKMYPPLGYHPDPDSIINNKRVNRELKRVYKYCEKNSVPITTHCTNGWPYSDELIRCREVVPLLCQPSSYENVLADYPNLRINFAHFGGDILKVSEKDSWAFKIREYLCKYKNVYTDLAYHDIALEEKTSGEYFKVLKGFLDEDIIKDKIIFGTDWLMTRHTWTEKEYTDAFKDGLGMTLYKKIAFENSLNFLFPNKVLPDRIEKFFLSKGVKKSNMPSWMQKRLNLG